MKKTFFNESAQILFLGKVWSYLFQKPNVDTPETLDEFNAGFRIWDEKTDTWTYGENNPGVTFAGVQAKMAELKAAEPMRLLRLERDRLLKESDWMVLPDRTPTQAQLDYRQALRDLPETQAANAAIDEAGNLINVVWPTKPE